MTVDKMSFFVKIVHKPEGYLVLVSDAAKNASDETKIKFRNTVVTRKQLRRALSETLKDGLLECKIKTELGNATGKEIQPSPALNAAQELWELIRDADSSAIDQEHGGQE